MMWRGEQKELSGGEVETTNQRMELLAAIEGLRALKRRSRVTLVTDSEYVRRGMEEWIEGWEARGWRTSSKKRVKNRDLWEVLLELSRCHEVEWRWVKAHDEDEHNLAVDELARGAALSERAMMRTF